MQYGLLSGILWAVDTVILGVALGMSPYLDSAQASFASAFMHDFFAAVILLVMMIHKGRLKDTLEAAKTKSGRVVMLGALLGGPIGMSGYLAAINAIGPGYTAAISAFGMASAQRKNEFETSHCSYCCSCGCYGHWRINCSRRG